MVTWTCDLPLVNYLNASGITFAHNNNIDSSDNVYGHKKAFEKAGAFMKDLNTTKDADTEVYTTTQKINLI